MNPVIRYLFPSLLSLFSISAAAATLPPMSVRIVDRAGEPVEGVTIVRLLESFPKFVTGWLGWPDCSRSELRRDEVMTDRDGRGVLEAARVKVHVGARVSLFAVGY